MSDPTCSYAESRTNIGPQALGSVTRGHKGDGNTLAEVAFYPWMRPHVTRSQDLELVEPLSTERAKAVVKQMRDNIPDGVVDVDLGED